MTGAGGGGRTHMTSEGRGILSPVRLPVPPLQRRTVSRFEYTSRALASARVNPIQAPLLGRMLALAGRNCSREKTLCRSHSVCPRVHVRVRGGVHRLPL